MRSAAVSATGAEGISIATFRWAPPSPLVAMPVWRVRDGDCDTMCVRVRACESEQVFVFVFV